MAGQPGFIYVLKIHQYGSSVYKIGANIEVKLVEVR